tara:strand:- start:1329 stop:1562 length:234 start_codon:yes stop_codon:yes gene_type:complete
MSLKAELERIMERIEELKSEPLRNKKDKNELEGLQLDRDEILMIDMNKGGSIKKKKAKKKKPRGVGIASRGYGKAMK